MKYFIVVELIEEEGPLEDEVMLRRVYPCKSYEASLKKFKSINQGKHPFGEIGSSKQLGKAFKGLAHFVKEGGKEKVSATPEDTFAVSKTLLADAMDLGRKKAADIVDNYIPRKAKVHPSSDRECDCDDLLRHDLLLQEQYHFNVLREIKKQILN